MKVDKYAVFKSITSSFHVKKFFFYVLNRQLYNTPEIRTWTEDQGGIFIDDLNFTGSVTFFRVMCTFFLSHYTCHATPEDAKSKCQKNLTQIHRECPMLGCDESECDCDEMYPVNETAAICSVSCGEGTKIYIRNTSAVSGCSKEVTVGICTREACPTTVPDTTTEISTTTSSFSTSTTTTLSTIETTLLTLKPTTLSSGINIGVVIGVVAGVVPLILVFLLVFCSPWSPRSRRPLNKLNVRTGKSFHPSVKVPCPPGLSLMPKASMPPATRMPMPPAPKTQRSSSVSADLTSSRRLP